MTEDTRLVPAQVRRALTTADVAALTPVSIEELTTTVIAALDVIEAIIPDLRTPHPATKGKVRGARTVPREAVASIVAMVEAFRGIIGEHLLDTERAREVLQHDEGFHILDERLQRLRAQVRYTVEARWAEVVTEAMNAYHIAKRLAKEERYACLVAHVETIRGHLARTNTPKKPK